MLNVAEKRQPVANYLRAPLINLGAHHTMDDGYHSVFSMPTSVSYTIYSSGPQLSVPSALCPQGAFPTYTPGADNTSRHSRSWLLIYSSCFARWHYQAECAPPLVFSTHNARAHTKYDSSNTPLPIMATLYLGTPFSGSLRCSK